MQRKITSRSPRRAAFSLIEFVVVMTIIGILAALIIPRFVGKIGGAKQAVARQNIGILETQVLMFQSDCGRLPTNAEGVEALTRKPADLEEQWKGPYAKDKDIIDPWGVQFMYQNPGRKNPDFDLWTFGADGQEGGEDENLDIGNW